MSKYPPDTRTGNFAYTRHRSNTQAGRQLALAACRPPGRRGPSPQGRGHDDPAHRSPHPAACPAGRPGVGRQATVRRMPVAYAPDVLAVPDDVVYGSGWIDESGRIADRAMTSTLGWQPGTG
jgi:hypothetical protein